MFKYYFLKELWQENFSLTNFTDRKLKFGKKKKKKKRKKAIDSGNVGNKKNLHPGSHEFFLINLIEFFFKSLHLKNYPNSTFLC